MENKEQIKEVIGNAPITEQVKFNGKTITKDNLNEEFKKIENDKNTNIKEVRKGEYRTQLND